MTKEIKQLLTACANFIEQYDEGSGEPTRLMNKLDEAIQFNPKTEFEEAVRPAIEWLAKNGDPHSRIIVQNNKAELFQGEKGFVKK